jgi:hypothetical protein
MPCAARACGAGGVTLSSCLGPLLDATVDIAIGGNMMPELTGVVKWALLEAKAERAGTAADAVLAVVKGTGSVATGVLAGIEGDTLCWAAAVGAVSVATGS